MKKEKSWIFKTILKEERTMRRWKVISLTFLLLAIILSACGGGGGGGGGDNGGNSTTGVWDSSRWDEATWGT